VLPVKTTKSIRSYCHKELAATLKCTYWSSKKMCGLTFVFSTPPRKKLIDMPIPNFK
jgi:hypothetical protein